MPARCALPARVPGCRSHWPRPQKYPPLRRRQQSVFSRSESQFHPASNPYWAHPNRRGQVGQPSQFDPHRDDPANRRLFRPRRAKSTAPLWSCSKAACPATHRQAPQKQAQQTRCPYRLRLPHRGAISLSTPSQPYSAKCGIRNPFRSRAAHAPPRWGPDHAQIPVRHPITCPALR